MSPPEIHIHQSLVCTLFKFMSLMKEHGVASGPVMDYPWISGLTLINRFSAH